MTQLDWVGEAPAPKAFKDIRNTRPTVAEEKAELALKLGRLCNKVPPSINGASVDGVRAWRKARDAAAKVAASKRSSVQELTAAISNMQRFA